MSGRAFGDASFHGETPTLRQQGEQEETKNRLHDSCFVVRAFVVNEWYLVAYEPMKEDGRVIGMLFVGVPEKETVDDVPNRVKTIRIGETGSVFCTAKEMGVAAMSSRSTARVTAKICGRRATRPAGCSCNRKSARGIEARAESR